MGEMPIVGIAVDRGILAHRRNANPIGERDVAQRKFAQQVRHGRAFEAGILFASIVLTPRPGPQEVCRREVCRRGGAPATSWLVRGGGAVTSGRRERRRTSPRACAGTRTAR